MVAAVLRSKLQQSESVFTKKKKKIHLDVKQACGGKKAALQKSSTLCTQPANCVRVCYVISHQS